MRARGTLVCVAALAGCEAAPEPVIDPVNVEVVGPAHTDQLAPVAVEVWASRLGAPELTELALPAIRWFEGSCIDYSTDTGLHCRRGVFLYIEAIEEVHLLTGDHVASSSLAHELLHWSLLHTTGDGDSNHTGASWAEVGEVQGVLKRREDQLR